MLLVPLIEALVLPIFVERAKTQKPTLENAIIASVNNRQ